MTKTLPAPERPSEMYGVNLREVYDVLDGAMTKALQDLFRDGRVIAEPYGISKRQAKAIVRAWLDDSEVDE